MQVALLIGMLLVLFMLGFAVTYSLGITAVTYMLLFFGSSFSLQIVAQKTIGGFGNFTLLAIPFFLLAGKLMNCGSITNRIFKLCNALVGWIPGGLGHANILASIVFAGMSGSAVADAAGLGTIEIRAMKDEGFDVDFAAAVTAASSTIGPIIPPSIPLIMYGVTVTASISTLLMAGIVPGVMMGLAMAVLVYIISKKRNYPCRPFPSLKEFWKLFKEGVLALLTPIILIGGILCGVFTATEASVVAVLYALLLICVIYREVGFKDIVNVFVETIYESAAVMLVVGSSTLFGYLVTRLQIPRLVADIVLDLCDTRVAFLLLVNVLLLIVGCFMETNAAILILAPILLPVAQTFGVGDIQFGIIMVLNLMIGLLTPPVGMVLYSTANVAHISFERMVKSVLPFYVPLFAVLLLVSFVPELSTWFPTWIASITG